MAVSLFKDSHNIKKISHVLDTVIKLAVMQRSLKFVAFKPIDLKSFNS